MVKRGFSTSGNPPCPADKPEHWDTARITAHDSSGAIERFRTKNGWAPFTSMGRDVGSLQPLDFALAPGVYAVGNPAVASLGGDRIMTVIRGSNGNIYTATTQGSGSGSVWGSIGTPAPFLDGDPAVVSWSQSPARVDVAIVGRASPTATSRVWKKALVSGLWEPTWENSMGLPPASLKGGVALASWGPNRLDVFVNDFSSRLWHQSWNPGWGGWDQPGGQCPGGAIGRPAAVSWGPNRIDIVLRAQDNGIWHFWWDNGWAPQWTRIATVNSAAYHPTIASFGPSRLDVFTGGALNRLYQLACTSGTCTSASSWAGWVPFGGVLTSSPAASSPRGLARIDIVAASDDGSALPTPTSNRGLWHKWWPWQ
jgi:hypothetical protein